MRKFMVIVVAAVTMSFGLVGLSTSTASAIECPYQGCVRTKTTIKAPDTIERRTRPTIRVRTEPRSGNSTVHGLHTVKCVRERDGRTKVIFRPYTGNSFEAYTGPRLGRGRWVCTARFTSDYKFRASSDSTVIVAR